MKRILFILFYAFSLTSLIAAGNIYDMQSLEFPILTGKIADGARALSPAQKEELKEILYFQEVFDRVEIIVATINNVPKDGLEWYGAQLASRWGIFGKKALLIVATDDKKAYIEAGSGYIGVLNDEVSQDIISRDIIPKLAKGDVAGGIKAGAQKIAEAILYERGYEGLKAREALLKFIKEDLNVNESTKGKLIAAFYEFSGRTPEQSIDLADKILSSDPSFDDESVQSTAFRRKMIEFDIEQSDEAYVPDPGYIFIMGLFYGIIVFVLGSAALNLGFAKLGNFLGKVSYSYLGGLIACFLILRGSGSHYLTEFLLFGVIFAAIYWMLKDKDFDRDDDSYSKQPRKGRIKRRR